MKNSLWIVFGIPSLLACTDAQDVSRDSYACSFPFNDTSAYNHNHSEYQAAMNYMTNNGVVGVTMSVYTPADGMWLGVMGDANVNNGISIKPCNLIRMGSTVKMFTATIVLQLQEEGKVDLDDKISDYLTGDHIRKIENADHATVRQLLQHSSGIYNYIENLMFQTASLNDLIRSWSADDLLKYAYRKPAYFRPGEDVRYSNTNYILLGLLIEKIEGKLLHQVFDERIINPLGLEHTLFAGKSPVPAGIVSGYIDLYSNLQVIESTYYSGWDYYTADGGLISIPYDMSVFIRALMDGHLVSQSSLGQMLDWKTPRKQEQDFYDIHYGLGIFKMDSEKGTVYFHSGDAIGYYANAMYFPEDGTTVVYAVNSNYGRIDEFVSTKRAIQKIIEATKN